MKPDRELTEPQFALFVCLFVAFLAVMFVVPVLIVAALNHYLFGMGWGVSTLLAVFVVSLVGGAIEIVGDEVISKKKKRWQQRRLKNHCPLCAADLALQTETNWCESCGWNMRCKECNYDLRGSEHAKCPECGEVVKV